MSFSKRRLCEPSNEELCDYIAPPCGAPENILGVGGRELWQQQCHTLLIKQHAFHFPLRAFVLTSWLIPSICFGRPEAATLVSCVWVPLPRSPTSQKTASVTGRSSGVSHKNMHCFELMKVSRGNYTFLLLVTLPFVPSLYSKLEKKKRAALQTNPLTTRPTSIHYKHFILKLWGKNILFLR